MSLHSNRKSLLLTALRARPNAQTTVWPHFSTECTIVGIGSRQTAHTYYNRARYILKLGQYIWSAIESNLDTKSLIYLGNYEVKVSRTNARLTYLRSESINTHTMWVDWQIVGRVCVVYGVCIQFVLNYVVQFDTKMCRYVTDAEWNRFRKDEIFARNEHDSCDVFSEHDLHNQRFRSIYTCELI